MEPTNEPIRGSQNKAEGELPTKAEFRRWKKREGMPDDVAIMFQVCGYDPLDADEWDAVTGDAIFPPLDEDGHHINFEPYKLDYGQDLIEVVVQRGLSWDRTAQLLRKLADRIEQNAADLSTLGTEPFGLFESDGSLRIV
jgi:hypothetical protein